MAQLAIKGHSTRGKKIIQLLEMLGGKNTAGFKSTFTGFYYWIDENNEIVTSDMPPQNSMVYPLEDFENKYPYKVGDTVISHNKWEGAIVGMEWSNDDIIYHVRENNGFISHQSIEELQPYKEEPIECSDKRHKGNCTIGYIQEIGSRDMELIIPYNQEIVIENGRYILRDKKPKYPKNYEECCNILGIEDRENGYCGYEYELLGNFQQLYICRNAYWKIAGDEMGLNKPWEPDWDNLSTNHEFIKIKKGCFEYSSRVLVFPTKEMRDTFYENFKDLIEQCKELL